MSDGFPSLRLSLPQRPPCSSGWEGRDYRVIRKLLVPVLLLLPSLSNTSTYQ